MSQFQIKITLGNDAMNTRENVASALQKVVDRFNSGIDDGIIMDDNGNRVGSWYYDNETDETE